jgi:endonuclease-3
MATTINKQRVLNHLLGAFHTKVGKCKVEEVLEQFIFGLCRENATPQQAEQAFRNLREWFFDWNEVRVSSAREVEEALEDVPHAETQAQRIISFLQEVFEMYYSYDLEKLHKEGLKQSAKKLARYQAANDYVCAWVVQRSLGGHAIPLDAPSLRCVTRLGLVDDDDLESARSSLEHLVPKTKGPQCSDALSMLAVEYCHETDPDCASCPMAHDCVFATEQPSAAAAAAPVRTSRVKPR